jgi:hypothetical protein
LPYDEKDYVKPLSPKILEKVREFIGYSKYSSRVFSYVISDKANAISIYNPITVNSNKGYTLQWYGKKEIIGSTILKALVKPGVNYIIIHVSLQFGTNYGHAQTLIINKYAGIIYFLDSQAGIANGDENYAKNIKVMNAVLKYIKPLLAKTYKKQIDFVSYEDYTNSNRANSASRDSDKKKYFATMTSYYINERLSCIVGPQYITNDMACATWGLFMSLVIVLNPIYNMLSGKFADYLVSNAFNIIPQFQTYLYKKFLKNDKIFNGKEFANFFSIHMKQIKIGKLANSKTKSHKQHLARFESLDVSTTADKQVASRIIKDNINLQDDNGNSALLHATMGGNVAAVKFLLYVAKNSGDINVNITNNIGFTALIYAVQNSIHLHNMKNDKKNVNNKKMALKLVDIIHQLLKHPRINVNKVCNVHHANVTALSVAKETTQGNAMTRFQKTIVRLLVNNGAINNAGDNGDRIYEDEDDEED